MADPKVNILITAQDKTKGVLGGVGSALGGLGKIALTAAAGGLAALTYGTVKAIGAASDLSETYNKVDVVFGDASTTIKAFASDAALSLGQTTQQALDAASTFGVFGKAAGLVDKPLADFSTGLTGLASDLASFYNADPSEVIVALGAGLRGESEPLRKFGILMDDATLRAKALELGIVSTTKDALTPQQRVLAAQAVIMDQTAIAQGDFARTSDGLANSQRILQAELGNLSATWGSIFLPIAQTVVGFLAHDVLPPFASLITALQDAGLFSSEFTEALGAIVGDEAAVAIVDFLKTLYDWLKVNLPIALQTASDFWTNTLLPAIRDVWQWMNTVLFPFIRDTLIPWLKVNVPKAIQVLADFWGDVLQPAIQEIWTFIGNFLDTVKGWWDDHKEQIISIAQGLWDTISGIFETFKETFENIVELFHLAQQGKWTEFGEKLREIWDKAWEKIKTAVSDAIDAIVNFFATTDWGQVGDDIVQGIANGITSAKDWIIKAVQGLGAAAIAAIKGFLGIKSPSTVFMKIGEQIGQGLIDGITSKIKDAKDATLKLAKGILDAAQTLGSIGGGFASVFQNSVLNPIQAQIDTASTSIEYFQKSFAERLNAAGFAVKPEDLTNQFLVGLVNSSQYGADAQRIIDTMQQRNNLERQYADEQARITALQEKQQQLGFLQQQYQLLQLIQENGLDAGAILDGLTLGLDADQGGLLDAMTRAMQALIDKANETLGVASPSKVFANIGKFLMQGLATGITQNALLPVTAGTAAARTVSNNFYLNANYPYQNPASLATDIRTLELLYGR